MKATATLALVVALCGCTPSPSGDGRGREREAVRAAYLDAWATRQQAVHQGDLSILGRRFSDENPATVVGNAPPGAQSALALVSDSVSARVNRGFDVRGEVGHDIQSIELSDDGDAAEVVDRVTDRTYLVDRVTGVPRSSEEPATYTEVWFLVRRGGEWKVIYFARA